MVEEGIKEQLTQVLAKEAHIVFAVLYGSAVTATAEPESEGSPDRSYRDLDVALWVDEEVIDPKETLAWAARIEVALRQAVDYPVDVRLLNEASLLFRYNVSRGVPLLINDKEAWYHFLERTWDEYLDFRPVAMAYLREMR